MKKPILNISMMMLTSKNYHLWIKELQKLAEQHKIWQYIDPEDIKESPKEEKYPEVSDYKLIRQTADGISFQTTTQVTDYDDLTTEQKKSLKMKMNIFQMTKKHMKKIAQSIRIVDNVVKLSARQYILSSEIVSLTRQIIQILISRYKKSEAKIVEQLHEQYYDLKTPPVKEKIEQWISDWENLRSKMISHDLKDTFDNDVIFVHEFLRAGKKWTPIFCETWVIQHEAAKKALNFFKTTRAYRNAYETYLKDEVSVRDHANAATLQGKTQNQAQRDEAQKSKNQNTKDNPSKKRARKCVCDEIYEFEECPYIVSSARKPDWTEDKKILDKIKQQLQKKPWILRVIKRICNTNLLNGMSEKGNTNTSPAELKTSFSFENYSFANTVIR